MIIKYRSRFLRRGEIWFDNDPGETLQGLDWVLYRQRSRPVPGAKAKYFYTFLVDLTQTCADLHAHLQKDAAYKIRRARERDGITCEYCDPRDPAVLDEFEQIYNRFAVVKGLIPLDRARMQSLADSGLLDISAARSREGCALLFHANYRDETRATLLDSPSLYRTMSGSGARNLVGRANRYLTWTDILRYKAQGLKCFDFGGWYYGSDPAMLKINDFKRGFGGRVTREYQCEQILSLKGWLVLTVAATWKRVRNPMARSRRMSRRHSEISASGGGDIPLRPTPGYPTPALHNSEVVN